MATPSTPGQETLVIGAAKTTLRDFYHLFLRVRWSLAIAAIVVAYLVINTLFAIVYLYVGGVENARPDSFFDALCFSVETMGTIGYGAMYPKSPGANLVMIVESVSSLIITAVATGLVFAKFSRSSARVAFSENPVIALMDGQPTLMLRVGNERGNFILEATIRLSIVRTERTSEGVTFYRMYDLRLARERSPAMTRSWTIIHTIDPDSPLFGATPESMAKDEVELIATLVGIDDTSMQTVHARKRYVDSQIVWGARHADILSEEPDGRIIIDMRKFHSLIPTKPSDSFPYPRVTEAADGVSDAPTSLTASLKG